MSRGAAAFRDVIGSAASGSTRTDIGSSLRKRRNLACLPEEEIPFLSNAYICARWVDRAGGCESHAWKDVGEAVRDSARRDERKGSTKGSEGRRERGVTRKAKRGGSDERREEPKEEETRRGETSVGEVVRRVSIAPFPSSTGPRAKALSAGLKEGVHGGTNLDRFPSPKQYWPSRDAAWRSGRGTKAARVHVWRLWRCKLVRVAIIWSTF